MLSNLGFLRAVGRARRKHFRRLAFRGPGSWLKQGKKPQVATSAILPSSGGVVLKATQCGIVRHSELVAMYKIIRRKLDKRGSLLIYTLPFVSITAKPLAVRMGKGKGAISSWVIPCIPGKLIFRIFGVSETVARNALRAAARKLNFETIVTSFLVKRPLKTRLEFGSQVFKFHINRPPTSDFFFHYYLDMLNREQDTSRDFKRKNQSKAHRVSAGKRM